MIRQLSKGELSVFNDLVEEGSIASYRMSIAGDTLIITFNSGKTVILSAVGDGFLVQVRSEK